MPALPQGKQSGLRQGCGQPPAGRESRNCIALAVDHERRLRRRICFDFATQVRVGKKSQSRRQQIGRRHGLLGQGGAQGFAHAARIGLAFGQQVGETLQGTFRRGGDRVAVPIPAAPNAPVGRSL